MSGISPLSQSTNPYAAQATQDTQATQATQAPKPVQSQQTEQVKSLSNDRDNDKDRGVNRPEKSEPGAAFGPAVNVTLSPQAQAAIKAQGVG